MVSRAVGRRHPPRPSAAALRPRETVVCFPQFLCDELSERVCADPLRTTLSPRSPAQGVPVLRHRRAGRAAAPAAAPLALSKGSTRNCLCGEACSDPFPATCPPAPASSAAAGGSCCRGSFQSASWRPAACRWVFW